LPFYLSFRTLSEVEWGEESAFALAFLSVIPEENAAFVFGL
jgi:hypothetical protein